MDRIDDTITEHITSVNLGSVNWDEDMLEELSQDMSNIVDMYQEVKKCLS